MCIDTLADSPRVKDSMKKKWDERWCEEELIVLFVLFALPGIYA